MNDDDKPATLYQMLDSWMGVVVDYAWGTPLVAILVGGGIYLTFFSALHPLRHFGHALRILTGRYDNDQDPGQVSHFQALTTALAATIGVGNIGGVAVAISTGGAGAVFWMWVAARLWNDYEVFLLLAGTNLS